MEVSPGAEQRPKIAIFSEKKWAFGRIHHALIKYMKQWYDFEYFDWGNQVDLIRLFRNEEWKNFDIILGNTVITYAMVESGWMSVVPQEYLNKCIAVGHTSAMKHPILREYVKNKEGPLYCGITQEVVETIFDEYQVKCKLTPIGIDLDHFYPTRVITQIKRAGIIGNPDNSIDIKRIDMFREICTRANIEPVFIFGKDFELHNKLYDDIDVFMYTSSKEGAGLGILEAACCNIPVITTKVGYSLYLKNIKTFDTVDEAIVLIQWLDSGNIKEYTETLSHEIRTEWNWKTVCEKYWKPICEKRLECCQMQKIKFVDLPIHVLTIPQNEDRMKLFNSWSHNFNVHVLMNKTLPIRNVSIAKGYLEIYQMCNKYPFFACDDDTFPNGQLPEHVEIPLDTDIFCLTNSSWRSTENNSTGEVGCFGYKVSDTIYRVQNMVGLSAVLVCTKKGAEYMLKSLHETIKLNGIPQDVRMALYQNNYKVYAFNNPIFYQPGYNEVSTRIKLDEYMTSQKFNIKYTPVFYSQFKQDEILESIFDGFKNGVFVDVGAHNGITFNNTLYFENTDNWTGINIEPLTSVFEKLKINRPNCKNYNCAISNVNGTANFVNATGDPEMLSGLQEYYDPRHSDRLDSHICSYGGGREVIQVSTRRLEDIIDVSHIHLLSIDVEGAEFEVIKSINFEKVYIDVILFENNFPDKSIPIIEYLSSKNYVQFNKSHELDIFMIHRGSEFMEKLIEIITW